MPSSSLVDIEVAVGVGVEVGVGIEVGVEVEVGVEFRDEIEGGRGWGWELEVGS